MKKYGLWILTGLLIIANVVLSAALPDADVSPSAVGDTADPTASSVHITSRSDLVSGSDAQAQSPAVPAVPAEELSFSPDPNCPLPWEELIVQLYSDYPIRGTVISQSPLESVTAVIENTGDPGEKSTSMSAVMTLRRARFPALWILQTTSFPKNLWINGSI